MSEKVEGLNQLLRKLVRLGGGEMQTLLGQELRVEGELIMTDAKENYVPVDYGTLRATGLVTGPEMLLNLVTVALSFGGPAAPYALAVHENPRAGKTGGVSPAGKSYKHFAQHGQWKFLEAPVVAAEPGLEGRIGGRLKGRIEALAKK